MTSPESPQSPKSPEDSQFNVHFFPLFSNQPLFKLEIGNSEIEVEEDFVKEENIQYSTQPRPLSYYIHNPTDEFKIRYQQAAITLDDIKWPIIDDGKAVPLSLMNANIKKQKKQNKGQHSRKIAKKRKQFKLEKKEKERLVKVKALKAKERREKGRMKLKPLGEKRFRTE